MPQGTHWNQPAQSAPKTVCLFTAGSGDISTHLSVDLADTAAQNVHTLLLYVVGHLINKLYIIQPLLAHYHGLTLCYARMNGHRL